MRRALGYKLVDTEHLLMQFIDHLERSGAATITTAAAVAWATAATRGTPNWQRRRLSVVRGFARHLHALDPACEVPPAGVLRCFPNRPVPHLYSDEEIRALMRAADTMSRQPLRCGDLPHPDRAARGHRHADRGAARMDRDDVDLEPAC